MSPYQANYSSRGTDSASLFTYVIYSKCNSHRKHTASENYSCKMTNTRQTRLQAWNHFSWGVIIITHQSPRRNNMLWQSQCKASLSVTYTKIYFTLSDYHCFLSHIFEKNPHKNAYLAATFLRCDLCYACTCFQPPFTLRLQFLK